MKTPFSLLLKTTIVALVLITLTITAGAQVKDSLVADETYYTELKASIKIETSNEAIYEKLQKLPFKQIRVSDKKDRNGAYKSYNVYFRKEDIEVVRKWIAKL